MNQDKMEDYTRSFVSLNSLWKEGKKAEFCSLMQRCYSLADNPYNLARICVKLSPDLYKAKTSGMPANVLVELSSFLGNSEVVRKKYEKCLTEEIQLDMFKVAVKQKNVGMMRLIVKTYQLENINKMLLPYIQEMQGQEQYKEVAILAMILHLQSEFSTESLIIPLFLEDRLSLADEFLDSSLSHQRELLTFIDKIIGKEISISDLQKQYRIKDVNRLKTNKMLCNTVAKLLKKFNMPTSFCPHMQRHRARGGLRYIFYKHYIEKGIQSHAFHSFIEDALNGTPDLAKELMELFIEYHEPQAAVPYFHKLKLNVNEVPGPIVRAVNESLEQNKGRKVTVPEEDQEECWDDGVIAHYSLKIPFEEIKLVTCVEEFLKCLEALSESSVVAVDSEWKPSFGAGTEEQAALLQLATPSKVFLLDLVVLRPLLDGKHWYSLSQLFSNPQITKLGYGIKGDFRILAKLHGELKKGLSHQKNVIDFDPIRHILLADYSEIFSFKSTQYKGLNDFVYHCFGLPLDKSDQFSNWEGRPLVKSQIRYAALDVVCLLDIYNFLNQKAPLIGIEDWRHVKYKKKKEKDNKPQKTKSSPVQAPIPKQMRMGEPVPASEFLVVCDLMVQGLAKQLRLCGIDAVFLQNHESSDDCIKYYEAEKRIVMSKGAGHARLQKFIPAAYLYYVQSESAKEQLEEVIKAFNIQVTSKDLFARCCKCNCGSFIYLSSELVSQIQKNSNGHCKADQWVACKGGEVNVANGCTREGVQLMLKNIAEGIVKRTDRRFYVCSRCGKCYWEGSHMDNFMKSRLGIFPEGNQEGWQSCWKESETEEGASLVSDSLSESGQSVSASDQEVIFE